MTNSAIPVILHVFLFLSRKKKPDSSREVSKQDRIKFSHLVTTLNSEELEALVMRIQEKCPEALAEEEEDEIEIEINNIGKLTRYRPPLQLEWGHKLHAHMFISP